MSRIPFSSDVNFTVIWLPFCNLIGIPISILISVIIVGYEKQVGRNKDWIKEIDLLEEFLFQNSLGFWKSYECVLVCFISNYSHIC